VDWRVEYDEAIERAMSVFLAFVEGWYTRDVENIFFSDTPLVRIKRFITSILGGDVLRGDNPLAADPIAGLRQLHGSISQAQSSSTSGQSGSQTRHP